MKDGFFDSQPVDLGSPYGIVLRKDIYPLYTGDLNDAVRLWQDYRRFGLPHGQGYAGESGEYIDLISAFEDERDAVTAAAARKARER